MIIAVTLLEMGENFMAAKKKKQNEAIDEQKEQYTEEHKDPAPAEKAEKPAEEVEEVLEGEAFDEQGEASGEFSGEETEAESWRQEKEELLEQLKRKQADMDNLRRIARNEQAAARDYALHDFLYRLLPILDNLERGIEAAREAEDVPHSYVEGLEMIQKQLLQVLEQEGVSIIEAEGARFDPHCHHAVMQVESEEAEPGTVVEELQKGYRHRERILRPAMVKVCEE